jgi:hypothetical protein
VWAAASGGGTRLEELEGEDADEDADGEGRYRERWRDGRERGS